MKNNVTLNVTPQNRINANFFSRGNILTFISIKSRYNKATRANNIVAPVMWRDDGKSPIFVTLLPHRKEEQNV
ncbi:hypothetical protein FACS1894208_05430 [Clostridia bacterium]|nr:hypothetical protein FACS1894208_05430 [Clostridia bacterium]